MNDLLKIKASDRLPKEFSGKESACNAEEATSCHRLHPWAGKIPWRREWKPTPVFLPWRIPWTEEPSRLQSIVSQSRRRLKRLSLAWKAS